MSVLPKLQSRIDRRRNCIRDYEVAIRGTKLYIVDRRNTGYFYGDLSEHLGELRAELAALVADQKLDKKLYGMALMVAGQDRFFEMIRGSIGEFS